jgi:Chain length determinant protein
MLQSHTNLLKLNFSLVEIIGIIKNAWKTIVFMGGMGLIGSFAYLLITPKFYEATAQIRLAQISQVNPANPFGTVVEEPTSLISRMQFPTNYSAGTLIACGYENNTKSRLALSKSAKFSVIKGVANAIELKVLSLSLQGAADCANAIFLQVQALQEEVSKPFVEEAKTKLIADNERIEAAKALILKADKSGNAMSAAYLSARDELTYFLTDREKMTDLINSAKNRGTRLASPIYVAEKPVKPKKIPILVNGLLLGILFGLVIALFAKNLVRAKISIN